MRSVRQFRREKAVNLVNVLDAARITVLFILLKCIPPASFFFIVFTKSELAVKPKAKITVHQQSEQ